MTDDEADGSALDRAIDELYAVDLDQFTARRTQLAAQARAAGDKDGAKAITALRKPTQSAFTINRLSRTDPSVIDDLIEVGSQMRQAQRSADGPTLRELNARRRTLLEELTRRAFEIIGQQSPSAGQRDEVGATLSAALADAGVAEQLHQGILVRAAEASGFGFSPPELTLIRHPARRVAADPDAVERVAPTDLEQRAATSATASSTAGASSTATAAAAAAAANQRATGGDREAGRAGTEATTRRRADAEKRRQQAAKDSAIEKARAEAAAADAAVDEAVGAIEDARQLIRQLQRGLADAKKVLEDHQVRAKAAETRQRKAREALHKAEG